MINKKFNTDNQDEFIKECAADQFNNISLDKRIEYYLDPQKLKDPINVRAVQAFYMSVVPANWNTIDLAAMILESIHNLICEEAKNNKAYPKKVALKSKYVPKPQIGICPQCLKYFRDTKSICPVCGNNDGILSDLNFVATDKSEISEHDFECVIRYREANGFSESDIDTIYDVAMSVGHSIARPATPVNTKPMKIEYRDFLVKQSTFKCRCQGHHITDIKAVVTVLPKSNIGYDMCEEVVSAGYCEECDTYFILNSVYEKLKSAGSPLCRVVEENSYYSTGGAGNLQLANESILMQFGYNVSQASGLSDSARRSILTVLVNQRIMTKQDVISYLDHFISLRKHNPQMSTAIKKWKSDRAFIRSYDPDYDKVYRIKSIHL